jgi:hypothetical protein
MGTTRSWARKDTRAQGGSVGGGRASTTATTPPVQPQRALDIVHVVALNKLVVLEHVAVDMTATKQKHVAVRGTQGGGMHTPRPHAQTASQATLKLPPQAQSTRDESLASYCQAPSASIHPHLSSVMIPSTNPRSSSSAHCASASIGATYSVSSNAGVSSKTLNSSKRPKVLQQTQPAGNAYGRN